MEIVKISHYSKMIEYTEEDGFKITRGDNVFLVYGTAESDYVRTYAPATRWDPPTDEIEQDGDITYDITSITDEDGNEVNITLTDAENTAWEDYMSAKLDDEANNDEWN